MVFYKGSKCKIETIPGKVIVKKGTVLPQSLEVKAMEYLHRLENQNIIRKSQSIWRNPVRFIEKPDGEVRLVLNLIALNDLVVKDGYQIPNMNEIIRNLYGSKWFSVFDLKEAFFNIEIEEEDKCKTAFEVKGRIYEFNGMVMGYKNSPMILQRILNNLFMEYLGKGIDVYLDDIIIYASTKKKT